MQVPYALFKHAVDTMGASVVILEPLKNRNGNISDFSLVYMNNEAIRITNAPQNREGLTFLQLTGLNKNSTLFELFAKTVESGEAQTTHARLNLANGKLGITNDIYDITCTPHETGLTATWQKSEKFLKKNQYSAAELFEDWANSFSVFELFTHDDGREDLRLLAANRTFANLISQDYDTLPGKLFSDVCTSAMDWLPSYIKTAKTGIANTQESYNYDLKKYLTAIQFSPAIGQVALLVLDRTHIWQAELAHRSQGADFAMLFSQLASGVCVGKLVRDEQNNPVDATLHMVNAAYELFEGFPTATMQGKNISDLWNDDSILQKYIHIVKEKNKTVYTKYVESSEMYVEVVCFSHGHDIFVCVENDVTSRVKAEMELAKSQEALAEQHSIIMDSINYASKIQRNLLPHDEVFHQAFSDHAIIWKPRDIVGGDIYWLKNFREGSVLCVCDCTGHGTPGALLTMLVISALEGVVSWHNYNDPASILWQLEQRLVKALHVHAEDHDQEQNSPAFTPISNIKDGCDLALLSVGHDGSVSISSGNMHVFVCDGLEVTQIKGQKIFIGEGNIASRNDIRVTLVAAKPNQKFYVASDGFFDQISEKTGKPFGYKAFKKIIAEHHNSALSLVSQELWNAFELHRGAARQRDDIQLIAFQR